MSKLRMILGFFIRQLGAGVWRLFVSVAIPSIAWLMLAILVIAVFVALDKYVDFCRDNPMTWMLWSGYVCVFMSFIMAGWLSYHVLTFITQWIKRNWTIAVERVENKLGL